MPLSLEVTDGLSSQPLTPTLWSAFVVNLTVLYSEHPIE